MRSLPALLLVTASISACTPGDEVVPEPEEVGSCGGLVDVGAQLVRAYVDVLEELRVDTVLSDESPPELVELERIGRDLDDQASSLDCDLLSLNAEIADAVSDLETSSPVAGLVLDIVEAGLVTDDTTPTATLVPPAEEAEEEPVELGEEPEEDPVEELVEDEELTTTTQG